MYSEFYKNLSEAFNSLNEPKFINRWISEGLGEPQEKLIGFYMQDRITVKHIMRRLLQIVLFHGLLIRVRHAGTKPVDSPLGHSLERGYLFLYEGTKHELVGEGFGGATTAIKTADAYSYGQEAGRPAPCRSRTGRDSFESSGSSVWSSLSRIPCTWS